MKMKPWCVGAALLTCVSTTAQAQLIVAESFNFGLPDYDTDEFQDRHDVPWSWSVANPNGIMESWENVQGYSGLGTANDHFSGLFERIGTGTQFTVWLSGLPSHDALSLDFLFAAIDSLDGTGTFPAGDFFHIQLDGQTIFRESFANALPSQIQSYVPPPGVELARRQDLGFGQGGFYLDSAYDFGADPQFWWLPHTGSTAVFSFVMEGAGIQGFDDESWAMDNLQIGILQRATEVPAPAGLWLLPLGLALLGRQRRRCRPPR